MPPRLCAHAPTGPPAVLPGCTDWGTSPFQSLGACVAAAAKSAKAKTAAVALLDSPLAGVCVGCVYGRAQAAALKGDRRMDCPAWLHSACRPMLPHKACSEHLIRMTPAADADAAAAAGKVANGLLNGGYESTRFKTKPAKPTLEKGALSCWTALPLLPHARMLMLCLAILHHLLYQCSTAALPSQAVPSPCPASPPIHSPPHS